MRLKDIYVKEFLAGQNIGRVGKLSSPHSTKGTNLLK